MSYSRMALAAAAAVGLCASQVNAATTLYLESAPGNWLGGGIDRVLTDADGAISLRALPNDFSYIQQTADGYIRIDASPADGDVIEPGSYLHIQRDGLQAPVAPGLDIGLFSRACNSASGHYFVHEYDIDASTLQIAIDFEFFCGSDPVPLRGAIRSNTTLAYPAPHPTAVIDEPRRRWLEDEQITLDGGLSFSGGGQIVSYRWSKLSGPDIQMGDTSAATLTFVVPRGLPLAGEVLSLQLQVTDAAGQQASVDHELKLSSKSAPQTFVRLNSEQGDYIGQGSDWLFDERSAGITLLMQYGYAPTVRVHAADQWQLSFAAPDQGELIAGSYDPAMRFPMQTAGVAGLSVFGAGRGCSQLSGDFDVLEHIPHQSLYVIFNQYCENGDAALRGELAYNAIHPSVPVADAGGSVTAVDNAPFQLDGTASTDEAPLSFFWQPKHAALSVVDPQSPTPTVVPTALISGSDSAVYPVTLRVTDPDGYWSEDEVLVTIVRGNEAPVASDDIAEFHPRHGVVVPVLDNDSDDAPLSASHIVIVQGPRSGTVDILVDGSLHYQPAKGKKIAADEVYYRLVDDDGASSEVAVVALLKR